VAAVAGTALVWDAEVVVCAGYLECVLEGVALDEAAAAAVVPGLPCRLGRLESAGGEEGSTVREVAVVGGDSVGVRTGVQPADGRAGGDLEGLWPEAGGGHPDVVLGRRATDAETPRQGGRQADCRPTDRREEGPSLHIRVSGLTG
jgi:hypothetical protein